MGSHPTPISLRERAQAEEQELLSRHPGFRSYKECMGRAYGWGVATFAITCASSYFSLKALSRRIPLNSQYYFIISALLGTLTSYHLTKERARLCNNHLLIQEQVKVHGLEEGNDELLKS